MSKKILFAGLLIAFIFVIAGCSKDDEQEVTKIKDIQAKEGIPVRLEKVEKRTLNISKRYSGTLRGKEEAEVSSMIGGTIESVNVRIGQYVEKDQVIAKFRNDEPSSQYRQAKAAFENSEENLKRYEKLLKEGAISQQTWENIQLQHKVNEANFEAAEKQIYVKAPISGYISSINVNVGDGVGFGGPVATITDLDDLKLRINVPEKDIVNINKDSNVRLIPSYETNEKYTGKITKIALTANQSTHNFEIEIDVDNPKGNPLRSGVIVEAEIDIISKENIIYALRENILTIDGKNYIYVVKDKKAKLTEINIGMKSGMFVEITSGLNEGDMLVTEGASLLENDILVKVIE